MRRLLAIALLLAAPASAQSVRVEVYTAAGAVASSRTYTPTQCGVTPKYVEALLIVNPSVGYIDDPANIARDCLVAVAPQISALPVGAGYTASVAVNGGVLGPRSTAFAVTAAQLPHECDTTPPTTYQVPVGQSFELGWCLSETDVNGQPVQITGWTVQRNGVTVSATVTAGTVSAGGERYYFTTRTETAAGTVPYVVTAQNAQGSGQAMAPVTVTAVSPLGVPRRPGRGRVR